MEAELAQQVFVAGEPVIGSQVFDAEDEEEGMHWAPGIIDRVRSDGQLEVSFLNKLTPEENARLEIQKHVVTPEVILKAAVRQRVPHMPADELHHPMFFLPPS